MRCARKRGGCKRAFGKKEVSLLSVCGKRALKHVRSSSHPLLHNGSSPKDGAPAKNLARFEKVRTAEGAEEAVSSFQVRVRWTSCGRVNPPFAAQRRLREERGTPFISVPRASKRWATRPGHPAFRHVDQLTSLPFVSFTRVTCHSFEQKQFQEFRWNLILLSRAPHRCDSLVDFQHPCRGLQSPGNLESLPAFGLLPERRRLREQAGRLEVALNLL